MAAQTFTPNRPTRVDSAIAASIVAMVFMNIMVLAQIAVPAPAFAAAPATEMELA